MKKYTIELTENEVLTLQLVLSVTGGCVVNSLRKYADDISDKLPENISINRYFPTTTDRGELRTGKISFEDCSMKKLAEKRKELDATEMTVKDIAAKLGIENLKIIEG